MLRCSRQRVFTRVIAASVALAAIGIAARSPRAEPSASPSPCAGEPLSCNPDKSVCCSWWTVDCLLDGKVTGAVLEDSYSKLEVSIEKHKRTDKALCAFFHDESDCKASYGEPRCASSTGGLAKQMFSPVTNTLADIEKAGETKLASLVGDSTVVDQLTSLQNIELGKKFGVSSVVVKEAAKVSRDAVFKGKLVESAKYLSDYTKDLGAALARAKNLRTALSDCMTSVNPFLDVDAPTADPPEVWRINFGYGFAPTWTQFGPPSTAGGQQTANETGKRSLKGLIDQAPTVPKIETLRIDGPAKVSRDTTSGDGRVLFTTKGTLKEGAELPEGEYKLLFAADATDGLAFASPSIARSSDAEGERITISASGGSASETISILVCSGGRTMKGENCACPGALTWSAGACGCPAGQHVAPNSQCGSCPSGTAWNGSSCECPGARHYANGKCDCCPQGTTWNGASCARPSVCSPSTGVQVQCDSPNHCSAVAVCVDVPPSAGEETGYQNCTSERSPEECCAQIGGHIEIEQDDNTDVCSTRSWGQPRCPW